MLQELKNLQSNQAYEHIRKDILVSNFEPRSKLKIKL